MVFSVDIARRVNNAMYQQSTLTGLLRFLADRTNGRAYATVLRLSAVCLWRYVLWLNGAS